MGLYVHSLGEIPTDERNPSQRKIPSNKMCCCPRPS
jgi:hypothetical protein